MLLFSDSSLAYEMEKFADEEANLVLVSKKVKKLFGSYQEKLFGGYKY